MKHIRRNTLSVCAMWSLLVALVCGFFGGGTSLANAATATDKVRFYYSLNFQGATVVMDIDLYGNESPLHVANFLGYVEDADYDLSFIHRTKAGSTRFLQGGSFGFPVGPNPGLGDLDNNPIASGSPVVNEFDASNGLSNTPGTLAAARTSNVDSATSGWFINSTNNAAAFDPGPYTVFGEVTRGFDLVPSIAELFNEPSLAGTPFVSTPFLSNGGLVIVLNAVRVGLIDGDYNLDGTVDAADYTVWLDSIGNTTGQSRLLQADGDASGVVDSADYDIWRNNIGNTIAASSATSSQSQSIPEPTTAVLLAAGCLFLAIRLRVVRLQPGEPQSAKLAAGGSRGR